MADVPQEILVEVARTEKKCFGNQCVEACPNTFQNINIPLDHATQVASVLNAVDKDGAVNKWNSNGRENIPCRIVHPGETIRANISWESHATFSGYTKQQADIDLYLYDLSSIDPITKKPELGFPLNWTRAISTSSDNTSETVEWKNEGEEEKTVCMHMNLLRQHDPIHQNETLPEAKDSKLAWSIVVFGEECN